MTVSLTEFDREGSLPIISICIPQYNRTSFVIRAIESFAVQTFRDFEICVSDGGSTDGRQSEVVEALRRSGLPFVFRQAETNLRYDSNLRMSLKIARGRYALLMGNDDGLNGPDSLRALWSDIQKFELPGVIHNNYCDDATGEVMPRIHATGLVGAGPEIAVGHYRDFSFVSGVVLDRELTAELATDRWDGAEMYQTYLGCRIIASGRTLLKRADVMIRKDLVVQGETVDAAVRRPVLRPCPLIVRESTLTRMPALIADAISPHTGSRRDALNARILFQHLGITMPFWLTEWRRVQSWKYAAGIALGLKPDLTARGVPLGWRRGFVWIVYLASAFLWLTVPLRLFDAVKGGLYRLAKRSRSNPSAIT